MEPSSAPGQNVRSTSCHGYFTYSCFLFTLTSSWGSPCPFTLFYARLLPFSSYFHRLGVVRFSVTAPPSLPHFQSFLPHPQVPRAVHLLGENPLSSFILPPSVLFISLSVCLFLYLSLYLSLSSRTPGPSPIFINIVLMIPDGLTCTLWGRSVSGFFQGCAWAVHAHLLDICMHNYVCMYAWLCLHVCIHVYGYMCSYQHLSKRYSVACHYPGSRFICYDDMHVSFPSFQNPTIELILLQLKNNLHLKGILKGICSAVEYKVSEKSSVILLFFKQ